MGIARKGLYLNLQFPFMKINETNVTIMVSDLGRSIAFYESIGFRLQQRWEDHYAMVVTTGLTLGLHPAGGELIEPGGQVSVGLMIDDMEEARALLESRKIKYDFAEGKSGAYAHFKDPDGVSIYFTVPRWSR